MQKYLDQVDKYLDAQQVKKTFLSKNQKDFFFLKASGSSIYLYQIDLSEQKESICQFSEVKLSEKDFSKCNFEFVEYFEERKILYFTLDENNNEFSNLYRFDLTKNLPELEQLTDVKDCRNSTWTSDHKTLFFINRYTIGQGLFRNEFYKLDLESKHFNLLFDDQTWVYQAGWGGFKLSPCEQYFIINLDKNSQREYLNFGQVNLNDLGKVTALPEPQHLLPKSLEDGSNYAVGKLREDGFFFKSNSSKFEKIYFFEFKNKIIQTITDADWINLEIGAFELNQKNYIILTKLHKEKNQTEIILINQADGKKLTKILKGNYVASANQSYLYKSSFDQLPTFNLIDENLHITQSFSKFSGQNLIHCTSELLSYRSFDQLEISAYLIKPKIPIRAVAVIAFYGGENYYHFHEQLFLENGIAIFSPAVRGSWGWGRDWEDHLKHDLGGKEIIDVIWAAKFISEKLNLPPKSVGVWGASHGGYAALRVLTLPKDFLGIDCEFEFGFGICECGFADLEDFYKTSRIADWLVDLLGHFPEKMDLYKQRSPIHFFQNLKAPLFIRHGTTDSRVPISTMTAFIEKLQNSDLFHEVMIQENQGHHTNDPQKLRIERAKILQFVESSLQQSRVN